MKKVNQGNIVNEVVLIAGVSKPNAVKIFNLFANLWKQDNIGLLKALDSGILVKTVRKTVKKAVKVKVITTAKKSKGTKMVATVKIKGKRKLKKKLNKSVPTVQITEKTASQATA